MDYRSEKYPIRKYNEGLDMNELLFKLKEGKITLDEVKEQLYPTLALLRKKNDYQDIVFYSFNTSPVEHITQHDMKRLELSVSSLRKYNKDIPIYMCVNDPGTVPESLLKSYDINWLGFSADFDYDMLNAWSIHRWYNMLQLDNEDLNILYLDSDTYFKDDVQKLFDTYCDKDVYGKEEQGFRHCPLVGVGGDCRLTLDLVDASIFALGGVVEVYKYCCGVLLLNNNVHKRIVKKLPELTFLMDALKNNRTLNPLPNPRILDQYAIWVILSQLGVENGLFGVQDVTHSYVEPKHEKYFNPIVLHYTTKDEDKFALSDPEFDFLIRDKEKWGEDIDPHTVVSRISQRQTVGNIYV